MAFRVNVDGDDVDADFVQYLVNDGAGNFNLICGPFITGEDTLSGLVGANLDGQPGDELAVTIGFTGAGNPEFVAIVNNPLGRVAVEALSGQQVRGPDFGNTQSAAIVEGQKFEDSNFNGVRDPGELGLNGVAIQALNANFTRIVKNQVTTQDMDLNGDNLIDPETERGRFRLIFEPDGQGENIVREVIPDGFLQTVPNTPLTSAVQAINRVVAGGFEVFGELEFTAWTAADITGDNAPDMFYAGTFTPTAMGDPVINIVQTFVNDGQGLFNDPSDVFGTPEVAIVADQIEFASEVVSIAVGDFDGGGVPDFAALQRLQDTVRVFLGDGSGQFTETTSLSRGEPLGVGTLHAVDIDNDTDIDLVAVNQAAVRALLNDGAGNFTLHPTVFGELLYGFPHDAVVVDLNNDNFLDVATTQRGFTDEDGLYVSLNLGTDGGGVWQGFADGTVIPFEIGSFDAAAVAAGNLDADPEPELVTTNSDAELLVLDSDGNGSFAIVDTLMPGLDFITDFGFIDQNKDGFLDVIAVGNEMNFSGPFRDGRFFRSDGQGGLTPLDGRLPLLARRIEVDDFDRDGDPDVGFYSSLSARLGYFDLLQPQHEVEADVGDTVTDINFGNTLAPNR